MVGTKSRVGIEPRRQARLRTREVLLSKPMMVAAAGLLGWVLVVLVGGQALLSLTGHNWSPTVFGFLLGAAVASVGWALWMVAIEVDGSWSWRIGARAEGMTAQVLERLGPNWRLQHNVVFYGGRIDAKTWITDIDCVATGPAGVLTVSTKWTSDRWDLSDPTDEWVLAASRVAANNADRLGGPLRQAVHDVPILPVVVCWGRQLEPIPAGSSHVTVPGKRYGDVMIVHGSQSDEWLGLFSDRRLDSESVAKLDAAVPHWITDHEDRHARTVEARRQVALHLRWTRTAALAVTVVSAAATAWWIAAVFNRSSLRALDHLARWGGGLGAALYVLCPVVLPCLAALAVSKVGRRAKAARLRAKSTLGYIAVATAAAWVLTFVATYLFS